MLRYETDRKEHFEFTFIVSFIIVSFETKGFTKSYTIKGNLVLISIVD